MPLAVRRVASGLLSGRGGRRELGRVSGNRVRTHSAQKEPQCANLNLPWALFVVMYMIDTASSRDTTTINRF